MRFVAWLFPCFAVALCGCTVKTVEIQPEFTLHSARDNSRDIIPGEDGTVCLYFRDEREDDTSHYKKLPAESAKKWLQSALDVLFEKDLRLLVEPEGEELPKAPVLSMHKAYVKHVTTVISGVVVLSLSYEGDTKYYRGQYVKTNWWGASFEYEDSLDRAIQNALLKISKDTAAIEVLKMHSGC